jgi:hypothetical protein
VRAGLYHTNAVNHLPAFKTARTRTEVVIVFAGHLEEAPRTARASSSLQVSLRAIRRRHGGRESDKNLSRSI